MATRWWCSSEIIINGAVGVGVIGGAGEMLQIWSFRVGRDERRDGGALDGRQYMVVASETISRRNTQSSEAYVIGDCIFMF